VNALCFLPAVYVFMSVLLVTKPKETVLSIRAAGTVCQPYKSGTASGQLCSCSTSLCNNLVGGAAIIARAELGISGDMCSLFGLRLLSQVIQDHFPGSVSQLR
jgi:hypothetical protein